MTAEQAPGWARALYVHLPFCSQRCDYCDFAIALAPPSSHQPYLAAVAAELTALTELVPTRPRLRSVYLGGGTPSLVHAELLAGLVDLIKARCGLEVGAEITLEANPSDVSEDSAAAWRDAGVNRVSLGVQSLDDGVLRWMGRQHDGWQALASLETLLGTGFPETSVDLICAVPGQSTDVFLSGLQRLLAYPLSHLSCYELTVEQGTPLGRRVARGTQAAPSQEAFLREQRGAELLLEGAGLRRYEVSNYARPGHESRHNLAYWRGDAYLGVGCGAHGFLGTREAAMLGFEVPDQAVALRYWNLRSASGYVRRVAESGQGLSQCEWLDRTQRRTEQLACGLRMVEGMEVDARALAAAAALEESGFVTVEGEKVRPTARGLQLADRLALELISA